MAEHPNRIGRYEIESRIAQGGQGWLFKAHDPLLHRPVAIKLLREPDDPDLRARFARECRAVANLTHQNIVTVFEVGEFEGQPFMAMEYIQGRTLTSIIESDVLPSIVRRLELVESLCDGLAFAHRRGVVHRDIKPANLMVDEDGRLKIVDFGIARAGADVNLTQAGLLVGTVNYMSPEQVEGRELGGQSDMFAAGAVLYELLSRRQAFPGKNPTTVLNRILNTEPEPLERVCPDLDAAIPPIVARALKKNPAERFADLHEMRLALARVREQIESAPAFDPGESVSMPLPGVITPPPTRRGTDLEELMRRRTQQIEAHLTAAELALASGRHHDAIARSEEALILDPSNSRAQTIAEQARQRTTSTGVPPAMNDRAGEATRASVATPAAAPATGSRAAPTAREAADTRPTLPPPAARPATTTAVEPPPAPVLPPPGPAATSRRPRAAYTAAAIALLMLAAATWWMSRPQPPIESTVVDGGGAPGGQPIPPPAEPTGDGAREPGAVAEPVEEPVEAGLARPADPGRGAQPPVLPDRGEPPTPPPGHTPQPAPRGTGAAPGGGTTEAPLPVPAAPEGREGRDIAAGAEPAGPPRNEPADAVRAPSPDAPAPPEPLSPPIVRPSAPEPRQDPPSAAVPDDEAVRRTLAAYAQAQARRDIPAVRSVYPNADPRVLEKYFAGLVDFDMEITPRQVDVAGNTARVLARVTQITQRPRDQRRETNSDLEFRLQRSGNGWIISDIRPR